MRYLALKELKLYQTSAKNHLHQVIFIYLQSTQNFVGVEINWKTIPLFVIPKSSSKIQRGLFDVPHLVESSYIDISIQNFVRIIVHI